MAEIIEDVEDEGDQKSEFTNSPVDSSHIMNQDNSLKMPQVSEDLVNSYASAGASPPDN